MALQKHYTTIAKPEPLKDSLFLIRKISTLLKIQKLSCAMLEKWFSSTSYEKTKLSMGCSNFVFAFFHFSCFIACM